MSYQTTIFQNCSICGESLKDPETGLCFKYYHENCIKDKKRAEKRIMYVEK